MQPRKRAHQAGAILSILGATTAISATEVSVCTDRGPLTIELFDQQAPLHSANFLRYVEHGFYSGTVFHRVVADYVVQGGGYDRKLQKRATFEPVENESRNGLNNARGTIAAARTDDPHSATSQFFVNLKDNTQLNPTEAEWGYTVFGRVTSGLEVLDAIGKLPTAGAGPLPADVPEPLVAVSSMAVLDRAALEAIPEASRVEVIQREISEAAATNDIDRQLKWIGHYRAICAPADSDVLLIEATAALAKNDVQRAQYVIDDYFAITDPSHPRYSSAQALARNLAPSTVEALARCEIPAVPELPNGSLDSLEQMVEGQSTVRTFMTASEMYLDCLSELIEGRELTDEQHASAVRKHNDTVARMEQLAEEFNRQVRIFKARED
jgi:cyclophilin family peptidyl-prolyl cis-trans isomerase